MIFYQTGKEKLSGTNCKEVRKNAVIVFNQIKKRTKRKPYLKSDYFNKQKIFLDYFWTHLHQKRHRERFKRLQYFEAAVDLIRHSRNHPCSKQNPNKKTEILHRFMGLTKDKKRFCVQIKENKKSDKKYFMSCFPLK